MLNVKCSNTFGCLSRGNQPINDASSPAPPNLKTPWSVSPNSRYAKPLGDFVQKGSIIADVSSLLDFAILGYVFPFRVQCHACWPGGSHLCLTQNH